MKTQERPIPSFLDILVSGTVCCRLLMATCQMKSNRTSTKVLPAFGETEVACTVQQSTTFVKKLVTVAVSTIMYMRGIFPENCFGDRMVGDLLVKLIRPVRDDNAMGQLIQLMGGCYDAIEKRYLRKMTVLVCTSDEDIESVVESYTCEMSYMGGNLCLSRNGEEVFDSSGGREIKEATVRLMRSLLLSMQTFDSLPGELFIHMKLAYYPDVTPDDYHPHGFVQAQPNTFKFAGEDSLKFIIGQVHTPFHSVGVHVKSVFCQEWKPGGEDKEIDLSQTDYDREKKQMEIDRLTNQQTAKPQAVVNDKKSPGLRKGSTLKKRVPTPHSKVVEDTSANQQSRHVAPVHPSCSPDLPVQEAAHPESATSPLYAVRCPCQFSKDDGLMVQCELCNMWQHCICFGLVTESDVPSTHHCVLCSKEHQVDCTDPNLAALRGIPLRAMCLWRKAVFAVLTEHVEESFTNSDLADRLDVEMGVSQGILKRLEREGFVKPKKSIARGKKSFIAAKTLSVLELKAYFKESMETFRMKGKSAGYTVQENQVERLTQKTAGLQLTSRKRTITDLTENSISREESVLSPDKRLYSKKLAKRALERMGAPPPADCTHDSEMDSQPKRRKQSISKKAIRV